MENPRFWQETVKRFRDYYRFPDLILPDLARLMAGDHSSRL